MAIKIGVIGLPNTGKSYARKYISKGEEVFILAPSAKMRHVTDSENKPLKRLNIKTSKTDSLEAMAKLLTLPTIHDVIPKLMKKDDITVSGNYVVCKLNNVKDYLHFINEKMLNIKTVIIPDFTHFLSAIMSDNSFIKRKAGGEAFQRFWELAGEALQSLIITIDELREDLVVITEYHCEHNEIADTWEIFVPGGHMLKEKFKLDSYYDFMLYTHVEKKEDGEVESYNFVTRKWGKYNARSAELFENTLIPNNLENVLTEVRKYNGLD